jgi:hypothetical protein
VPVWSLALLSLRGQAQTTEALNDYKTRYPGQHIVQALRSETVRIDLVKGVPTLRSTRRDEYVVTDKSMIVPLSEETISFSSFEQIENIEAYALVPKDKTSRKVAAIDFKTRDAETQGSVFHDDMKETSFTYPGLVEGALRVLKYETAISENRFPSGFSFASYIPVEKSVFQVDCDSSIHLLFKEMNFKGFPIQFEEKIVRNRRVTTWTCLKPDLLKHDENMPASLYFMPAVYTQIAYFHTKKGRVNVLSSLADLHAWYRENIQESANEPASEEIKTLTASLIAGKTSELEKVKAIYYWVQDNIKYIAFEEGINGFVPRLPSQVCKKRYGDCKDMASLIHTMLKEAGIVSYVTWIGSRELPFKYSEFPSTTCDNHMITTYYAGDTPYFLDATSSFQPIEFPTSFIQGKEALLHISNDEVRIIEVPTPPCTATQMIDTCWINIENRKIKGSGRTTISGYYNFMVNESLQNVPSDKLNQKIEGLVQKGNNTFKVTKAATENVSNRAAPLILKYEFEFDNYVSGYARETYINMILEKTITGPEMKEDRKTPYELECLTEDQYTVILNVPEGMHVKSVPADVTYTSDFVDYKVSYQKNQQQVVMTLQLDLKFLLLYPENFATWNAFEKVMKKSMAENVVLEKNN